MCVCVWRGWRKERVTPGTRGGKWGARKRLLEAALSRQLRDVRELVNAAVRDA